MNQLMKKEERARVEMDLANKAKNDDVFLFGSKGEILFSDDEGGGGPGEDTGREHMLTSPGQPMMDKSFKLGSFGQVTGSNFVNNS